MAAQGRNDMDLADVLNENVKTVSASELIWSLKSAFQKSYFTKVESILVSREKKLLSEIESKLKEYNLLLKETDSLEEKYGMEMMKRLRVEKELEGCHKACVELEEANSRLTEELEERQRDVIEFKRKKFDLECAKSKAEIDVDVYKRKCEKIEKDLQMRVARLEKESVLLENLKPLEPVSAKVSEWVFEDKIKVDNVKVEMDVDVNENVHCEAPGPPNCFVPEDEGGNLNTADSGRPLSKSVIIEIPDSDDDSTPCEILSATEMATPGSMDSAHIETENETGVLKRKWALCVNKGKKDAEENDNVEDGDGSCPNNNKHEMKKDQELIRVPHSSPAKRCSTAAMTLKSNNSGIDFTQINQTGLTQSGERMGTDHKSQNRKSEVLDGSDSSSLSSSDSEDVLDLSVDFSSMTSSWFRKRWESEVDMTNEFQKDEQLCMEAVCVLYRTSQYRGFDKLSTTRGATLAKFLTDGDPKGKLKKSKADLMAYDSNGLDDCRSIAIFHSKELFEIYQNKEDVFLN